MEERKGEREKGGRKEGRRDSKTSQFRETLANEEGERAESN